MSKMTDVLLCYLIQHGRPRPLKLRAAALDSDSDMTDSNVGSQGYRRRGPGKHRAKTRARPTLASAPSTSSSHLSPLSATLPSSLPSTSHAIGLSGSASASASSGSLSASASLASADQSEGCANCRTPHSPLWRRGKDGLVNCNACGLFWKTHGRVRPIPGSNGSTPSPSITAPAFASATRPDAVEQDKEGAKDKDTSSSGQRTICSNCSTPHSTLWRKDPDGKVCCNACGLHVRKYGVPKPVPSTSVSAASTPSPDDMDIDRDGDEEREVRLPESTIKRRNRKPRAHIHAARPYPSRNPSIAPLSRRPSPSPRASPTASDAGVGELDPPPLTPASTGGLAALLEAARGLDMVPEPASAMVV